MDAGEKPITPNPTNFLDFIPWACAQLQLHFEVRLTKEIQDDYVSTVASDRSKGKGKAKVQPSRADTDSNQSSVDAGNSIWDIVRSIKINCVYDASDNLVSLRFEKFHDLPRQLFKIIGLIVKFHQHLYSLSIKAGLNKYCVYEISKFLPFSKITDICFDNCFMPEANYYVLLDNALLKYLSLSKCKIDDVAVAMIASKLEHPLPSSTSLIVLNLSTNHITDVGAKSLSHMLRSNRKLGYLNLADNMISDKGASEIFNILLEFPLSHKEVLTSRKKFVKFLRDKNDLILLTVQELRNADSDRRNAKRKSNKIIGVKKDKLDKEMSLKSVSDRSASVDVLVFDKAEAMVDKMLGAFNDPYSGDNVRSNNGLVTCLGNNALVYLNLAYNQLTYTSIKKLLNVLIYQKMMDRKPKGLMNMCVEGNAFPIDCQELIQIDNHIDFRLRTLMSRRKSDFTKKKPMSGRK